MESEDWVTFQLGDRTGELSNSDQTGIESDASESLDPKQEAETFLEKRKESERPIDSNELREWLDRFGYS